jgi:hypothetical protein
MDEYLCVGMKMCLDECLCVIFTLTVCMRVYMHVSVSMYNFLCFSLSLCLSVRKLVGGYFFCLRNLFLQVDIRPDSRLY